MSVVEEYTFETFQIIITRDEFIMPMEAMEVMPSASHSRATLKLPRSVSQLLIQVCEGVDFRFSALELGLGRALCLTSTFRCNAPESEKKRRTKRFSTEHDMDSLVPCLNTESGVQTDSIACSVT